ncbi:hypothetical protein IAR55_001686 [Kwoniella newhampshirensis]|uniref:Uncharacterized protein n=1 Tax=Kwoniella newhampshirensis TaxID=1651941 RepID=A0AAW0Z2W2_9TREE
MVEIPSSGLEFFEYRRRLFLAGLPPPSTPTTQRLPPAYLVSRNLPDSLTPPRQTDKDTPTAVKRLEQVLSQDGAEELQETWDAGVGSVARSLHGGKRLAKGLKLGLVIKILRASWIQEGLWPIDPKTRQPLKPPDSPLIQGTDLFPVDTPPKGDALPKKPKS